MEEAMTEKAMAEKAMTNPNKETPDCDGEQGKQEVEVGTADGLGLGCIVCCVMPVQLA